LSCWLWRRAKLSELAVSIEQQQIYAVGAATAAASYRQALNRLAKAQLNLSWTEVRSPVDGWVTNLTLRQGDYAVVGRRALSLVDAHSFWVDGFFEETTIGPIADGDPASVWLMGFPQEIKGHVDSLSRAINVPNAQANAAGIADVNPVFTWVRLAQRVPVRIHLDVIPESVRLVEGMTATVQVHPRTSAGRAQKKTRRIQKMPGVEQKIWDSNPTRLASPLIARVGMDLLEFPAPQLEWNFSNPLIRARGRYRYSACVAHRCGRLLRGVTRRDPRGHRSSVRNCVGRCRTRPGRLARSSHTRSLTRCNRRSVRC
jgi:hypothetical protein